MREGAGTEVEGWGRIRDERPSWWGKEPWDMTESEERDFDRYNEESGAADDAANAEVEELGLSPDETPKGADVMWRVGTIEQRVPFSERAVFRGEYNRLLSDYKKEHDGNYPLGGGIFTREAYYVFDIIGGDPIQIHRRKINARNKQFIEAFDKKFKSSIYRDTRSASRWAVLLANSISENLRDTVFPKNGRTGDVNAEMVRGPSGRKQGISGVQGSVETSQNRSGDVNTGSNVSWRTVSPQEVEQHRKLYNDYKSGDKSAYDKAIALVRNIASSKIKTLFRDKNGVPLTLYHGSNRFGETVFDKKSMMFTTDSEPRASGYGGPGYGNSRGFSRKRDVERFEPFDFEDTDTVIRKAKSVLGYDFHKATAEDRANSFDKRWLTRSGSPPTRWTS